MAQIKKVAGGFRLCNDAGQPLGPTRASREQVAIKDERRLAHFSKSKTPIAGAKKQGAAAAPRTESKTPQPIALHPVEGKQSYFKFPPPKETTFVNRKV